MTTTRPPRPIRSKISTMPRKQSEADHQLELYKLITEKQRIQEKLEMMERQIQQLKNPATSADTAAIYIFPFPLSYYFFSL